MRREALEALLRLRNAERRAAQQALAAAIRAEAEARAGLEQANAAITDEARAAIDLSVGDGAVEAYARWLPVGRRVAADAAAGLEHATHDVTVARAALLLAKTEENAVASMLEQCLREIRQSRMAREQAELDEVASRRRLP